MNAAFPLMGNSGASSSAATSKSRLAAEGSTTSATGAGKLRMKVSNVNFYYGKNHALHNVSLDVATNRVTALIGPSGCGKSTLLRTLNRMYETLRQTRLEGEIALDGVNILTLDVTKLRRLVGMVFQKPNPFPKSIYENVSYGLRINGYSGRLDEAVEKSLRRAALWDEVKDKLHKSAYALSGGQQQRLCIARALAVRPEILLMDEPASALDPIATQRIEELIYSLKSQYTIVIVTHNMQQAARVSDYTAFFWLRKLIEVGPTDRIFTHPVQNLTEDYITGRFG